MRRDLFLTMLAATGHPMIMTKRPKNIPTQSENITKAKALMTSSLMKYIPRNQRTVISHYLNGSEAEWYAAKMIELDGIVKNMPVTGKTDGQGENAIVHLHYFGGGSFNAWITEKDIEGGTFQAFGRQDLFGDGGELGYVCIDEIVESRLTELDLHWNLKPMKDIHEE